MMETEKKIIRERLFYEIIVKDESGKVISWQKDEAHSFLKAYNQLMVRMMGAKDQTIKDTVGVDQTDGASATAYTVAAPIGSVMYGIRIGTGSTAVTISDYAMEAAIAEGTGAGQMSHQAQVLDSDVTVSDPDCTHELKRIINNGSGGTIVVTEIGIYVGMGFSTYGCIARDVLGASVSVPNGGTITVIYTWKITE